MATTEVKVPLTPQAGGGRGDGEPAEDGERVITDEWKPETNGLLFAIHETPPAFTCILLGLQVTTFILYLVSFLYTIMGAACFFFRYNMFRVSCLVFAFLLQSPFKFDLRIKVPVVIRSHIYKESFLFGLCLKKNNILTYRHNIIM